MAQHAHRMLNCTSLAALPCLALLCLAVLCFFLLLQMRIRHATRHANARRLTLHLQALLLLLLLSVVRHVLDQITG